jgi:septum formation protein
LFFKDPPRLILASTSRYRRELLGRLRIPFDCVPPEVEETPGLREVPADLAGRLARAKAQAVAVRFPAALVVGSDQVAVRGDEVLGKPLTVVNCTEQLHASSGRDVVFLTAVHIIDGRTGRHEQHVDRTTVRFRTLEADEITRYIERDQPLDCAGGFKAESLGIALFERIESLDPTALTGLPLAWLAGALRRSGLTVP